MTFPTPYTVGWHSADTSGEDSHGGETVTYSPDLEAQGTLVKVMGWAPTRAEETSVTRVESDIDLFVPPGVAVTPQDVVDLPLDQSFGRFEVVAYPEDWTKGPFGFTPGAVVKLKRVEG